MHNIFAQVVRLIQEGQIRISAHGYDELAKDNILVRDVVQGIHNSTVIEEYPDYHRGPCILVKQMDGQKYPIHIVWGIARGSQGPAVLVTGYRPDPDRWNNDYTKRL